MRVLHVLDHSIPLQSGYAFRTLSILKQQRALGWETFHLTGPKQHSEGPDEETVDGWSFYRTAPSKGLVSDMPVLGELELMGDLAHRIEHVVRRVKPHLLHAHSPVLNALPALRVGRRLRLPVVYEIRAFWEDAAVDHGATREGSLRYKLTRAVETFAARRADAVITICEGLRDDLVARGIARDRITVVPNAVDLEEFSPGGVRDQTLARKLGLEGCVVLGFIGSFYGYEGLEVLIESLPAVLPSNPNVRVLLVGGGPSEQRLRARAAELGLLDKVVVFTGRVPHSEVQRYYNLVDVFVYPRLSMRLTDLVTPLKPLEAMAQGGMVIASDVGGHRELMRGDSTAMLFRAGDHQALAARIRDALAAQANWDAIRAAGRRFVEQERNWALNGALYRDVYARLIGGQAA